MYIYYVNIYIYISEMVYCDRCRPHVSPISPAKSCSSCGIKNTVLNMFIFGTGSYFFAWTIYKFIIFERRL